MKKLAKLRDHFEQLERDQIKQEDERAKCDSLKDDQFMALSAHIVASMSQNPGHSPSSQPCPRPTSNTVSSYGDMYSFDQVCEEHESD